MHLCCFDKTDLTTNLSRQITTGVQVCFAVDANVLLVPSLAMNGSRWVMNIIVVV